MRESEPPVLRLADPLRSDRLGGWALIESPRQQVAADGQRWSLIILTLAVIIAIAAIVLDLRIPTGPTAAISSVMTPTAAPRVRAPESPALRPSVEPPARTVPALSAANAAAVDAPPPAAAAASLERAPAAAQALPEPNRADAGESAAASALIDDPASRIREYLGLHAGAQLPVFFKYEVQAGDTASSIAARFGLEEDAVLFNNFDIYDANQLTVGQILQLPSIDGVIYTVQPQDTLSRLEQNFQADIEATVAYPANGISSPDEIKVGQTLLLVQGSASIGAASSASGAAAGAQSVQAWVVGEFEWPLAFDRISDPFGTPRANSFGYHTGVDFEAAVGTIVGSTAAGQVTVATWGPSYGNWVEIDHGGGYRSRYAHLDQIWVWEGQWISSNHFIGTVGNTGNSTGAHLHFEIIINGQAVNPLGELN